MLRELAPKNSKPLLPKVHSTSSLSRVCTCSCDVTARCECTYRSRAGTGKADCVVNKSSNPSERPSVFFAVSACKGSGPRRIQLLARVFSCSLLCNGIYGTAVGIIYQGSASSKVKLMVGSILFDCAPCSSSWSVAAVKRNNAGTRIIPTDADVNAQDAAFLRAW